MSELAFASLKDLSQTLQQKHCSALELTQYFLQRIQQYEPYLSAFTTLMTDEALAMAKTSDARRQNGQCLSALDGIPIVIKDLCDITGYITTAGTTAFNQNPATQTAPCIQQLQRQGMIILGKTQMVELAFGGWGTNLCLKTPKNPWDCIEHRITGGSSSGSAVAVAAGLAPLALGSDTGGSIRIPAALNGLTGLKTTYGLISTVGTVPLSTSLDTLGPLARTAEDAWQLTLLLAQPQYQYQLKHQFNNIYDNFYHASKPLKGMRFNILPAHQYPMPIEPEIAVALQNTYHLLAELGADIDTVPVPFDFNALREYNSYLMSAEAYASHHQLLDHPQAPLGKAVYNRLLAAKSVTAKHYIEALRFHQQASQDWQTFMQPFDALITPTVPMGACLLRDVDENETPLSAFTRASNFLTGSALTLPIGLNRLALPIGVQLMAKACDEARLSYIGNIFQSVTQWHLMTPDLSKLN